MPDIKRSYSISGSFSLRHLRALIEKTKHLDFETPVSIAVNKADYNQSDYYTITVRE